MKKKSSNGLFLDCYGTGWVWDSDGRMWRRRPGSRRSWELVSWPSPVAAPVAANSPNPLGVIRPEYPQQGKGEVGG